jgi:hypothetical protein
LKVLSENLHELDDKAFDSDTFLFREMKTFSIDGPPLVVILIRSNKACLVRNFKLTLRRARAAQVNIYDINQGTYFGSHYYMYCSKRNCSFVQFFGYYTRNSQVFYDPGWNDLPYFVSSKETSSGQI